MVVAQRPGRRHASSTGCSASRQNREEFGARIVGDHDAEPRQIPFEQELDLDQQRVHVVGRDLVLDMRRDRQHRRQLPCRAAPAARRPRSRSARRSAPADRLSTTPSLPRSSMISRPCCRSACRMSGADEALRAQPLRHRDERHHRFGEMRDLAVGLAVLHRRPVGPLRRVHQDRAPVAEDQAVIAAGRGVAGHALARRLAQAGLGDELAHRRDAVDPRREGAVAGDAGVAEFRLELGRQRQRHVDAVGRQEARGAVGPFHHHHGVFRQIVEAELGELRRSRRRDRDRHAPAGSAAARRSASA